MKTCMTCEKIEIVRNYRRAGPLRVFVGLPFVYLPIVFLPLFLLSAAMIYIHLRFMGAQNLNGLGAFLPDWKSHRYTFKTQITRADAPNKAFWVRLRAFWFFNCTFYCPFSVAVLDWHSYLVKTVEVWWCPFTHSRKDGYGAAARIDGSYWHASGAQARLHPDDRANPIWSEQPAPDVAAPAKKTGA